RRADPRGVVTYDGPRPATRQGQALRLQEKQRLQYLERVGLAEKIGSRTWRLSSMTEPALRQAQLAHDIIKSQARHLAHDSDPRMPFVVTTLAPGTRVTGRVVGTGLADERPHRRYCQIR